MSNHPSKFLKPLMWLILLTCVFLSQPVLANPSAGQQAPRCAPKSLYCVQGTVVVKGWERDLIRRDPALAKFHWSPIKAAKPGTVRWPQPISANSPNRFRPLKPTVMSFDEALAIKRKREAQISSNSGAKTSTNARVNATLNYPNNVGTSTYASYSTSGDGYNYAAANTASAGSGSGASQRVSSRVQGRLIVR